MLQRLGLTTFFFLLAMNSANAAEITAVTYLRGESDVHWESVRVVTLKGDIALGDELRLKSALRGHEDERGWLSSYTLLALDSPGGGLNEALKLIRLVRERTIPTYVPAHASCLSACAFVFMAGTQSWDVGNEFHGRFLDVDARLGFHAPYPSAGDGRFDQGVGAIADIFDALGELDADLYFAMLTTPRGSFTYADTVNRIGGWNIQLVGYREPEVTERAMLNACFNIYRWFDQAEQSGSVIEIDRGKASIEDMAAQHSGAAVVQKREDGLRYHFEHRPYDFPHCELDASREEVWTSATGKTDLYVWYANQPQNPQFSGADFQFAPGTIGIPPWWLFDPHATLDAIARDDGSDPFSFLNSSSKFGGVGP